MIKIAPRLDDQRYTRLFHIGAKHQWTVEDVDWTIPDGLDTRGRQALARLLTPVFLGERAALLGGAQALLMLGSESDSAQLYMPSFLMDEARHIETITHLYDLLGFSPMRIKEMPEMLQYHHRMRMGKTPLHWVMGILISDIFARTLYGAFARTKGSFLFGRISSDIVVDEGRHQAFAEHYLSDRLPVADAGLRQEIFSVKEDLLRIVARMGITLKDDASALGFPAQDLFSAFSDEVQTRSRHVGLRCGSCPAAAEAGSRTPLPASCQGCFVSQTLAALAPPPASLPLD